MREEPIQAEVGTLGASLEASDCAWRRVRAHRAAFLVDGERYFEALRQALRDARQRVLIAGWDLHTQIPLVPGRPDSTLEQVFASALDDHPELRIDLLVWRPPWPLRFQRQWFTRGRLRRRFGDRVRFAKVTGSHFGQALHQKVVVIDDALAFVGGIDLTAQRWDQSSHRLDADERMDPWGDPYEPWHDVQLALSGEAAAALGEMLRERWRDEVGIEIPPADGPAQGVPWRFEAAAAHHDVPVVIARTLPGEGASDSVREIEALYREVVGHARRWIYLENQYFASEPLLGWLEERLDEPDGPEIVLVSPARSDGWLDSKVMGSKRAHLLSRLKEHANAHRVGIFEPVRMNGKRHDLFVHAKVAIADLDYASVGSANLANRSFRLDTECDVGVLCAEARRRDGEPLLYELLAEHLDAEIAEVRSLMQKTGSLLQTIEKLRGRRRTLEPFEVTREDAELDMELAESLDPERPLSPGRVLGSLLRRRPGLRRRAMALGAASLALLLGLAAAVARL